MTEATAVVTLIGISAAIQAGSTGPQMNVAGFRLGSKSAAEGAVALESDTDVDDYVYSGDLSALTYNQIDDDTLVWRIKLDTTVGDFDVGNFGIVLDGGDMLCKAVLPGKSNKYKSNPPTVVGNVRFYNLVMRMANAANLINLSIIEANTAALPEVATELVLPDPVTTPFNTYLVRNHTRIGAPVIATRLNDGWWHAPHRTHPGQGLEMAVSNPSMFDIAAIVGTAVYLDPDTKTYKLADGAVEAKQALGIRTREHEITRAGMVNAADLNVTVPLVPGTIYYVATGVDIGSLTTTANGRPVAYATTDTELQLVMAGPVGIDVNFSTESLGIDITGDTVDPTVSPGSVVYLDMAAGRVWKRADPAIVQNLTDYSAKRPTGVINYNKTRVVVMGSVKITTATPAWPTPLVPSTMYFCDTGTAAGRLTLSSSATRWIVGFGLYADTLFVRMFDLASDADHLANSPTRIKAATPHGVSLMIAEAIANLATNLPTSGEMIEVTTTGVVNFDVLRGVYDANPGNADLWPRQRGTDTIPVYFTTADFIAWLHSINVMQPTTVHSYTAPGTYSLLVPSTTKRLGFRVWGGGGAGGNGNNGGAGSGGSGAEYREGRLLVAVGNTVEPGDTLSIIVGAGGIVNLTSGGNGGNGGLSSIVGIVTSMGGLGGLGTVIAYDYKLGVAGGTGGSGGDLAIPGSTSGPGGGFWNGIGGGAFCFAPPSGQYVYGGQSAGIAGSPHACGGSASAAAPGGYPLGGAGAPGRIDIWLED